MENKVLCCCFCCFFMALGSPVLANIPFIPFFVFPEEVFSGVADLVNQFFHVGVGFVADAFRFALQ